MAKWIKWIGSVILLIVLSACGAPKQEMQTLKKVDFILDWTPNTNHTGLYVAKEKGYFSQVGIDLDIKLPPENSSVDLVANNTAPFAINSQDFISKHLEKGSPITAVSAIIEDNTSGIVSKKQAQITQPKDMINQRYGTWNDPIELAMIKSIMANQSADFNALKLVPNTDSNAISAIENNQFDSAWIYYGWDGVMAKEELKLDINFFYLKDYEKALNYYTPVIISNTNYLKENKEDAKKIIQAIKKGYQYAMEHPQESAEILIKYVPELKERKEFVIASQRYLSQQYAKSPQQWGEIDSTRWNAFYTWLHEQGILEKKLPDNTGFTNDYLK